MTGRIIPLQADRHREVQALLPWYISGQLDDADHAGVSAHIAGCAECQAELRADLHLAETLAAAPAPGVALFGVEHGWAAMRQRLDAAEQRRTPLTLWMSRLSDLRRKAALRWSAGEPWMRWAVAGQFCALLMLGGLLLRPAAPAVHYQALGARTATAPANIVVIFRPETRESEMRALLEASHARLVDGPTSTDAYMLHVPDEERSTALARLRGEAPVVLAEPIDPARPG